MLNRKNFCKLLFLALFALNIYFVSPILAEPAAAPAKDKAQKEAVQAAKEDAEQEYVTPADAIQVKPLELVENPAKYLNKNIIMNAAFDKFSTLGLDYNKALRPSTDYLGFLIQRDDVIDHNIPLSELKLFLKRTYAEKFIDLDTGDRIEIVGKVFSNALNDAWVDVNKITVTKKAKTQEETKKR